MTIVHSLEERRAARAERPSRYLVVGDRVYRDESGERVRIVYATRTGTTLALDERSADALRAGCVDELAPEVSAALRESEALVAAGEDELATILERSRRASADLSALKYTLVPTSYCNMACAYCGQAHARGALPPSHRDGIRARVLAGIRRSGTRAVKIGWFGAEPMAGYPVVRDLSASFVAAADACGVAYAATMVTNGSLLTLERLDVLVNECRVGHLEITLDGPAHVHDRHRPLKSGKASFHRIVGVLERALAEPRLDALQLSLRTNVDVHNRAHVSEYIRFMGGRGCFATDRVSFSIHSVHPWGNDVSQLQLAKQEYAALEAGWMEELLAHDLRIATLPSEPKPIVCSAVTRSAEVLSSTGRLFSCTEHPLVPAMETDARALGRVDGALPELRPAGPFDDWHDAVECGETPCTRCTFLPVCGGSCPKAWREGAWPCPTYKIDVERRLDLTARLNGLREVAAAGCEAAAGGAA